MKFRLFVLTMALGTMAHAATVFQSASGGAIPDNNSAGVLFPMTISDTGNVTDVQLILSGFSHTWVGDLVITLAHGANTVTVLNCGSTCSANFVTANTYTFASTGTNLSGISGINVTSTSIPTDTYASAQSFSSLFGSSAAGTWNMRISDNGLGDVANADWTWSLQITTDTVVTPEPGTFAPALLGLAGILLKKFRK